MKISDLLRIATYDIAKAQELMDENHERLEIQQLEESTENLKKTLAQFRPAAFTGIQDLRSELVCLDIQQEQLEKLLSICDQIEDHYKYK